MINSRSGVRFIAENLELAGFSSPGESLYITLRELLENSIDACRKTERKEVNIAISRCEVLEPLANACDGVYVVKVQDSGAGIAREHLLSLFGETFTTTAMGDEGERRGKFGLGLKGIILCAQRSPHGRLHVITTTAGQEYAYACCLGIHMNTDTPFESEIEVLPKLDPQISGTQICVTLPGDMKHALPSILEYLSLLDLVSTEITINLSLELNATEPPQQFAYGKKTDKEVDPMLNVMDIFRAEDAAVGVERMRGFQVECLVAINCKSDVFAKVHQKPALHVRGHIKREANSCMITQAARRLDGFRFGLNINDGMKRVIAEPPWPLTSVSERVQNIAVIIHVSSSKHIRYGSLKKTHLQYDATQARVISAALQNALTELQIKQPRLLESNTDWKRRTIMNVGVPAIASSVCEIMSSSRNRELQDQVLREAGVEDFNALYTLLTSSMEKILIAEVTPRVDVHRAIHHQARESQLLQELESTEEEIAEWSDSDGEAMSVEGGEIAAEDEIKDEWNHNDDSGWEMLEARLTV